MYLAWCLAYNKCSTLGHFPSFPFIAGSSLMTTQDPANLNMINSFTLWCERLEPLHFPFPGPTFMSTL